MTSSLRRGSFIVAVALAFAVIPAAHPAPKAKRASFSASFAGRLDLLVRPTGVQGVAWASGTGTGIGKSVFLGTGPAFIGLVTRVGSCPDFSGVFSITAANGDKLFGAISRSKGCRTSPTSFRSSGSIRVLGGTGKLASARGPLSYKAQADLNGVFSITLSGTL